MEAYAKKRILIWDVPPKSPDFSPIEMFWGWLRKQLRHMDLEDLRKKRPLMDKAGYTARVKSIMRSQKAVGGQELCGKASQEVPASGEPWRYCSRQLGTVV